MGIPFVTILSSASLVSAAAEQRPDPESSGSEERARFIVIANELAQTIPLLLLVLLTPAHAGDDDCEKKFPGLNRRTFLRLSLSSIAASTVKGLPAAASRAGLPTPNKSTQFVEAWIKAGWNKHPYPYIVITEGFKADSPRGSAKPDETTPEKPPQSAKEKPLAEPQYVVTKPQLSEAKMGFLKQMIAKGELDWIALEIFPVSLQADVNTYIRFDTTSDALRIARKHLVHTLSLDAGEGANGETHPLLSLIDLAKDKGVKIYAVGLPLGKPVSERIPQSGRGIIAEEPPADGALPTRFHSGDTEPNVILIEE